MTDENRPYRKTLRAEQEAETVRRITLAAVELHGSIGASRTSMSAIAELAGVRRSTLYRHFADEAAVFVACTAHYMGEHPLPGLDRWTAIRNADERLAMALQELYAYYTKTKPMLSNMLRDESTVDAVRRSLEMYHGYLDAARQALLHGRKERAAARRRVAAAIGHALSFSTWQSLVGEQQLSVSEAVELMCGVVSVAADAPKKRRR